jgi:hypothetical protein
VILFLKKKPPKLLEELLKQPPTVEALLRVLEKHSRSKDTPGYVKAVYEAVLRHHPDLYEQCVKKYERCGAAAVLACTFYVVGKHKDVYEDELQAYAVMMSQSLPALGPKRAVSEVRAREKDFKNLRRALEWFDRVC